MNYREVIANIRDLGFSDDAEMEEFGELVPNSINRAITEINLSVAPNMKKYEVEVDESDTGYLYFNMVDADPNFLDFADTPVLFERDGTDYYTSFSKYEIETNDTIVIEADGNRGSYRIFYKAQHDPFSGNAEEMDTEIPLPLKVHHLVPLLAAYYVWLEDEPAKAAQYYNMYETKANVILNTSETNIRVKVLHGGI